MNFKEIIAEKTVEDILKMFPLSQDFLHNLNLPPLSKNKTFEASLADIDEEWFSEFGLRQLEIPEQLAMFLETATASAPLRKISSLTIIGGQNKFGEAENTKIILKPGDAAAVVGPTGSGKSRLLADIECLAQSDTPTKRSVLIDGEEVDEETRFNLDGKLVAQLSQNMNFVMDITVAEFLETHTRSRGLSGEKDLLKECFECANSLAGEKFTLDTKVTQLSGGQSRALMIADCAYISMSPVVLIDEIENAGVDRRKAIEILVRQEKIALISTHDPLLALGADMRIVIKNGGVFKVIETSEKEKETLKKFEDIDVKMSQARAKLRAGEEL